MAALSGGQTWGLSNANANANANKNHDYADASNAAPAPNKSVVLVKLTDATLRTLEDYARLRQQVRLHSSPLSILSGLS